MKIGNEWQVSNGKYI